MKPLAIVALGVAVLGASPAPQDHSMQTLIVAHRGASYLAPENTLSAFKLAWELGADRIEGDFYLTSDGYLVAHHDRTTEKTAGVDVPVAEQTLADLLELDVGSWKNPKWVGERMPTLSEVLETVPPGKQILIESKMNSSIVPALVDVMQASKLHLDQMIVISFDAPTIAAIKQRLPKVEAYWLADFEEDDAGRWQPTAEEIVATARQATADGVGLQAKRHLLDRVFVQKIRSAGLEFHVWTVNDPADAAYYIALGVDSITTDRPQWLREQVGLTSR